MIAFILVFLFFIFKPNKFEKQITTNPVETSVSVNEALEEPNEKTSPIPSEIEISHKENVEVKTGRKKKSTLELLEVQNHASAIEQAKEMGVSTEGSTLEILERINRKTLEEYLK